ncbi:hypothetical protein ACFQU7_36295 [Pseudoroseomonas wenyumeiae]
MLEGEILAREAPEGAGRRQRRTEVEAASTAARAEVAELESRWRQDLEQVAQLRAARAALRAGQGRGADPDRHGRHAAPGARPGGPPCRRRHRAGLDRHSRRPAAEG